LNEVMLILPPVQFGKSRYRLFVTHIGCGQRYCRPTEIALASGFLAVSITGGSCGAAPSPCSDIRTWAVLRVSAVCFAFPMTRDVGDRRAWRTTPPLLLD
jgi:hypothetical protein